jgi:hypothetical protein
VNGVDDAVDIEAGAGDCNGDGVLDECEISKGSSDRYGVQGSVITCVPDGVPDVCQVVPDCNGNGIPNKCEIINGARDAYGVTAGGAPTCQPDGIPDSCQPVTIGDCDGDGILNSCEIAAGAADAYSLNGTTVTCTADGIPDSCPPVADCNGNGIPNSCEIAAGADDAYGLSGTTVTCTADGIPDSCQQVADCDDDGRPDFCEITVDLQADAYGFNGTTFTCGSDGIPDSCQAIPANLDRYGVIGTTVTCAPDNIPDSCQVVADCDADGRPDFCELTVDLAIDCDLNGVQDSCQIEDSPSLDLDLNAELDECQDPARIAVMLTDAPIDEFLSLVATLDSVQLVKADGTLTSDVLSPAVRVELIGTATMPQLLWHAEIPFGSYRGVRLGFTGGAPLGRLNNGTASAPVSISGGGVTYALTAPFATGPKVVGEGSVTRCVVDFDLEWSLGQTGLPATAYTLTPIGETRIQTAPAGITIEPIRGEVIGINLTAKELTLRAFVDDDCLARAGELVVELNAGTPAILYDSVGQVVANQTAFLEGLTVGGATIGFGTVLEVHGAIQSNGALRATRVNTENGRLTPTGPSGGTTVEFDGLVVSTPSTSPSASFNIAVSDVEMGRSLVLTAIPAGVPAVLTVNHDPLTRFINSTGAEIGTPTSPASDLKLGMRVKVKYTEFTSPVANNVASVVELVDPLIDFEGILNSISGLSAVPPNFVMRLAADEWAIQAGLVTNSTTNVTVDLGAPQVPVFLRVTGSPAITLTQIPLDTIAPLDSNLKLDTVGVLSGPAGSPTITATRVRLFPGRVRGGAVVDLAPQLNGELLVKLSGTQVIDPFGQNYIDNQTRVVLLASANVFGDRTSLSKPITFQELIQLGNDPTCDLEVIAKGLSSTNPLDGNARFDIYELRIRCR